MHKAYGALVLVMFSLAMNALISKWLVMNITPLVVLFLRFVVADGALYIWIKKRHSSFTQHFFPGTILGVVYAAAFVCLHFGLQQVTVSKAAFIFSTFIIWTPLLGLLIGDRVALHQIIGTSIVLAGLLVFNGFVNPFDAQAWLLYVGAILVAGHITLMRYFSSRYKFDRIVGTFHQCVVAAVLMLVFLLLNDQITLVVPTVLNISFIAVICFMALFGNVVQLALMYFSAQHVSATNVSLMIVPHAALASVIAWIIGMDALSLQEVIGGVIITAGLFVAVLGTSRPQQTSERRS